MKDVLEELADLEVRQPPAEFDRQLHARVNRALIIQHLADFVLGAIPWAIGRFFAAVLGLIGFTLTGSFKAPEDGGRGTGDEGR
jgi:hypothetical protein